MLADIPPFNIRSVGSLCGLLSLMPRQVDAIAEQLDIRPAARIDGVPYYRDSDVDRIADLLRRDHDNQRPTLADYL